MPQLLVQRGCRGTFSTTFLNCGVATWKLRLKVNHKCQFMQAFINQKSAKMCYKHCFTALQHNHHPSLYRGLRETSVVTRSSNTLTGISCTLVGRTLVLCTVGWWYTMGWWYTAGWWYLLQAM